MSDRRFVGRFFCYNFWKSKSDFNEIWHVFSRPLAASTMNGGSGTVVEWKVGPFPEKVWAPNGWGTGAPGLANGGTRHHRCRVRALGARIEVLKVPRGSAFGGHVHPPPHWKRVSAPYPEKNLISDLEWAYFGADWVLLILFAESWFKCHSRCQNNFGSVVATATIPDEKGEGMEGRGESD